MGQTKRAYERGYHIGYQSIDKYVCNHCVSDSDIKNFIKENGSESTCNYCEKSRAEAIEFDELIEFILPYIDQEYGDPLNGFVNMEDGEIHTIHDLLDKFDITEQDELREDIIKALIDKQWCEAPYYSPDLTDALKYGWEGFVKVVKHKSRYVFYRVDEEHPSEPIPPSVFLDKLSNIILRLSLYQTLKNGTFLYRVRIENKLIKLHQATELATPRIEYAKYSNRMSPAGIPMFYGAFDIGTAIKETYDPSKGEDQIATIAKFKLLKNITLVDLTKIPQLPRFFQETSYNHHEIRFLNDFVVDISKSIEKDGKEHMEYVPTQIVTEHLRYIHNDENSGKIHGIIYPSSKNKGKNSVVIFCENEHFVEKGEINEDSFFELESLRRANPKRFIKD